MSTTSTTTSSPRSGEYLAHQETVRQAAKLTSQIVEIRDGEGISFDSIAKRLGIGTNRARRLFNNYIKRAKKGQAQPTQEPGPEPYHRSNLEQVTVLERGFAKGLLEGKGKTQAARDLGIKNPSRWSSETFQRPNFVRYFHQLLERNGFTEDYVAKVHREQLAANRVIYATKDGKITDTMQVPDNQARMNAVKIAWELYERIGNKRIEQDVEQASPLFIEITPDRRKKLEALCGETLECHPIDDDGKVNFHARVGAEENGQTDDELADDTDQSQQPSPSESDTSLPAE